MKHTRQDVIRMAGHLLLHHPTTGWFARQKSGLSSRFQDPQASCFCLYGALFVSADRLGRDRSTSAEVIKWSPENWNRATDAQRRAYATRMANYTEGEVLR